MTVTAVSEHRPDRDWHHASIQPDCVVKRLMRFKRNLANPSIPAKKLNLTSMKTAVVFLLILAHSAVGAGSAEKDVLAAVEAWKQAALTGHAAALSKTVIRP
jgi:hypothetical protein